MHRHDHWLLSSVAVNVFTHERAAKTQSRRLPQLGRSSSTAHWPYSVVACVIPYKSVFMTHLATNLRMLPNRKRSPRFFFFFVPYIWTRNHLLRKCSAIKAGSRTLKRSDHVWKIPNAMKPHGDDFALGFACADGVIYWCASQACRIRKNITSALKCCTAQGLRCGGVSNAYTKHERYYSMRRWNPRDDARAQNWSDFFPCYHDLKSTLRFSCCSLLVGVCIQTPCMFVQFSSECYNVASCRWVAHLKKLDRVALKRLSSCMTFVAQSHRIFIGANTALGNFPNR